MINHIIVQSDLVDLKKHFSVPNFFLKKVSPPTQNHTYPQETT